MPLSFHARAVMVALAALSLCAVGQVVAQQAPSPTEGFNGLGSSLGNLSTLSRAKTRSISPENFTGEKGKGGMATEGTGAEAARDLGQGGRSRPRCVIKPGADLHAGRHRRPGRHPAHLDDADRQLALLHPAHLLGRRDQPSVEVPVGDFFADRLGAIRAGLVAGRLRQPGQRVQLLLGDALPQDGRITMENIDEKEMTLYYQINYTLTDVPDDAAYFHAPVPPRQPAALQGRSTPSSTASRAGASTSAPTWPGASTTTAGGARARSSSSWTATPTFPTICGTGTEDYFCGSYNFENQTDEAVPGVHDALRRAAAGDPARRRLQRRSSASACTAGTSSTRSASRRTCG